MLQVIETALNNRLVFGGPFDVYWLAGMTIFLIAAISLGIFIWQDRRKVRNGNKTWTR